MKHIAALLVMAMVTVSSCRKYEEGPGISFVSKKGRVSNEWAFASAIENDVDVTDDYRGAVLTLSRSGNANFQYFVVENGVRTLIEQDGEWNFTDRKEHLEIILYAKTGSYSLNFKIKELRQNNMHLISNGLGTDWRLVSNNLRK